MKSPILKVVRVGNSKGIRLPSSLLARYRIGDEVEVETKRDGIMLRPVGDKRLSWDDTYKAMAAEHRRNQNEFDDMDILVGDGLDGLDR